MRSVDILGVRIDDVTYAETIELIDGFIREGGPHSVVTPNPEIVMLARRNPDFRAILNRSALAIPDGIGLLLASRLMGRALREHVQGTDLLYQLASLSPAKGWRWYLLGAAEGVAPAAAAALQREYPGLEIVGAAAGSPRPEEDEQVRGMIRSAGAVDLIIVAYGAPLQERWMERNLGALGIPVGIGVGGSLNYLAGGVPRAPRWILGLHLEFLHRLLTQPWRWRRQLVLPRFVLEATAEAVRLRVAGQRGRHL